MAVLNVDIHVNDDGSLAIRKVSEEAKKAESSTNSLRKSSDNLSSSFLSLKSIIGFIGIAQLGKETIQAADSFKLMEGRLSLVTKGTIELATAQEELFKISQNTRQSFKDTVDLYTSLSRSTQQLGKTQKETLGVTETINKAIIISGSSAESSKAALVQLGQGFASGTLRGEELNSVLEQTPRIAEAIAKGMGKTIGELRQLGADGKLTGEAVFEALQKQSQAIDEEFSKMPKTVSQATTQMGNSLLDLVGVLDKSTGASNALSNAITGISKSIDEFKRGFDLSRMPTDSLDVLNEKLNRLGNEWSDLEKRKNLSIFSWDWLPEDAIIKKQKEIEGLISLLVTGKEGLYKLAEDKKLLESPILQDRFTRTTEPTQKQWEDIYDEQKKAYDKKQSEITKLSEEWAKRKLELTYENEIAQSDELAKPFILLEKKYKEDLDHFKGNQEAKNLLTQNYYIEAERLQKDTIEKFNKQEEEKYKKSNEWQVKLFDANEKINDQFIAQREKMYGATSEAQIEAWYQNQLEWLGKLSLEGKATSEELQGLLDKINSLKNLKLQEQTLSFKVEKSFYNSLEGGLTNTIENAFNDDDLNLNSFFKNIKKGLTNTLASDFSSGIVNNFKTFTGFGGAASSLVGASLSASDLTSLASAAGSTVADGKITTAGGTVIDQASGTVTSQGSDALSLLNTASSLKTAYGLITNGVSGTILSGFESISGGLASMGFGSAAGFLGEFGVGFASPWATQAASAAAAQAGATAGLFGSGVGQVSGAQMAGGALSSGLMGAGLGYGVGTLGDKIFGAQTKAGSLGAAGGAIGSVFGPVGMVVGAVLGSVLGGMFGSKKVTGSAQGIDIFGNATADSAAGQYWAETYYKKKSWFSSKSWTEYAYQGFSDKEVEAIKSTIGVYDYLLAQLGEYNDLVVSGGRFSNLQSFLDTNVVKAFLVSINPSNLDTIYQSWTDYAAEIDKTITEALATAVSGYTTYKRGYTEWFLGSGTVEQLAFTSNYLQKDFEALASSLGASSVTVDNFLSMYDAAIKNNFTQDTIEAWASLGDALMKSTDATKKYKDALDSLNGNTTYALPVDTMLTKVNNTSQQIDIKQLVTTQTGQNDTVINLLVQSVKTLQSILKEAQFGKAIV